MKNNIINYYLVSDFHLGHGREIEFGRPEGYEEKIFKGLDSVPGERNILLCLGDICIGNDEMWHKELMKHVAAFRTKILIKGNHDHKSNTWYYDHGWDFVCKRFADKLFGKRILFSHVPQLYDKEKIDLNIHGHLHDNRHRGSSDDFNFENRVYKLVSMEFSNYQSVNLKNFLNL